MELNPSPPDRSYLSFMSNIQAFLSNNKKDIALVAFCVFAGLAMNYYHSSRSYPKKKVVKDPPENLNLSKLSSRRFSDPTTPITPIEERLPFHLRAGCPELGWRNLGNSSPQLESPQKAQTTPSKPDASPSEQDGRRPTITQADACFFYTQETSKALTKSPSEKMSGDTPEPGLNPTCAPKS